MHVYLVWHIDNAARAKVDRWISTLMTVNYFVCQRCVGDGRGSPTPGLSLSSSHAERGHNLASQCASYRDTIFEGDPLQGVAVCNPMLNEFLPQGGRDAGGAAVRADLSPGQALGQFALRLGTRSGPREDGLAESSSSIPHRQDGRKLRHLLLEEE